ncbi:MAG: hypothetical protein DI527_00665 [Chelatococcus sp.]|nr:MAG: hypothetical protein DI527_00665 [Chelatococcus sp.]
MTAPAAFLILEADRRVAGSCTHVALPVPEVTLSLARQIKAHAIYGLRDLTPARFRFAALRRPADMLGWAERRGARIAVEAVSAGGLAAEPSPRWRL